MAPTWSEFKSVIGRFLPRPVRRLVYRARERRALKACEGLSVAETFDIAYKQNFWRGSGGTFYSGRGSDSEFATPYVNCVRDFIVMNGIKSVVDIGCGDFRVGRQLLIPGVRYTGIDIVPSLIEHHRRTSASEDVRFETLNAIEELPPQADVALIRQVLQHLSNDQALALLRNCRHYRFLIISEHLLLYSRVPFNIDKPHGLNLRGSGILLEQPPFSLDAKPLMEVSVAPGEVIRTSLVQMVAA